MRLRGPLFLDPEGTQRLEVWAADSDDNDKIARAELHVKGNRVEVVGLPAIEVPAEDDERDPTPAKTQRSSALEHPLQGNDFK